MKHDTILHLARLDAGWFDLRPLRASDVAKVEYYAGDIRVAIMTTTIPHPLPTGAAADFVAQTNSPDQHEVAWAMDATKSGGPELMGVISMKHMDRDQSEVGYWVAPPFWNKGTAQAAVSALLSENPLQNSTIFASVFQDNPASAKVLTNLGFQYLGDAESFSIARNVSVPTWTYIRKLEKADAA